jgi:hypothetical protein
LLKVVKSCLKPRGSFLRVLGPHHVRAFHEECRIGVESPRARGIPPELTYMRY